MEVNQPVPLFSAAAANAGIDFSEPLMRVVNRHWYIMGEEVKAFEREFAGYVGADHCISVANGSEALEIALLSLGVGPGDRVITVANAGFYSSTAIRSVGAEPVYVDVDDRSLTMCTLSLKKALSKPAKVVIVTHLYGQMADIETIHAISRAAGVAVVEDCAQSHGARSPNGQCGSFGDLACFSFYPTKNLGALGDGGAIVTSSDVLAERLLKLRQYGWSTKYHVTLPSGRNSRLDEMQAAILRVKLPLLDQWNEQRRAIAQKYCQAFASLPVRIPTSLGQDFVAHLFVLRVEDREAFTSYLNRQGISTDIHYPIPDHKQTAYTLKEAFELPVTENISSQLVSLPCFPGLTDEQINRVIEVVITYFKQRG
ncbi:DegT/DnrJ/EryC1/StrS family aminotransferase [Pseudomonas sp. 39167]|uniref:DegT/DnrJ/EryC1/StrS family aminotransferase n=1 Tax=Pseudomonas sp. 39167 TaxID=2967215 RepID=UPI002364349C|nr:DegT/DnrJ/EryC1/StrS family aminotransferase [Pseudomonas sp. 39167]MDD2031062.1 DegT/DnrJ/EryC1/StrS family aminotransferase [Pseudomonas sp. 39167]